MTLNQPIAQMLQSPDVLKVLTADGTAHPLLPDLPALPIDLPGEPAGGDVVDVGQRAGVPGGRDAAVLGRRGTDLHGRACGRWLAGEDKLMLSALDGRPAWEVVTPFAH